MKIRSVLFFVVSVLSILLIISLFFPERGLKIGSSMKLKFLTFDEIIYPNAHVYADLNEILKRNINIDSLINIQKTTHENDTLIVDADELKKTIQTLEFGSNGPVVLYSFFEKLNTLKRDNRLMRIMHYGDSQIENDRISSFLRHKLQSQFGGSGIGLLPVVLPFDYTYALNINPSSNWKRYTGFGRVNEEVQHSNYGILASFSRFAPLQNDSILFDTILYEASVDISPSRYGYNNAKKFSQLRLLFANNKAPVSLKIFQNDTLLITDTLYVKEKVSQKKWVFDTYKENLTLQFSGFDSPDIYGFAFDNTRGIAVDNIPLRGSSGTIFTAINKDNLRSSFSYLNTELFILQFGGNVLPYITTQEACKNYANSFYSQLMRLKAIKPNAAIIVVGPADKSIKDKENFVTYPLLEPLIDQMKEVTFKAGGAYWDIYKAMGGYNSMPAWVEANLAAKDYIHFSSEGAVIIANMLYNAIIYEYNNYVRQKFNN